MFGVFFLHENKQSKEKIRINEPDKKSDISGNDVSWGLENPMKFIMFISCMVLISCFKWAEDSPFMADCCFSNDDRFILYNKTMLNIRPK